MIKRLEGHKQANCYVIIESESIKFISYQTMVIEAIRIKSYTLTNTGHYDIKCTGLYSRTTRKQIGWFLNEYFNSLNYYDIKDIAYTDKTIIAKRSY